MMIPERKSGYMVPTDSVELGSPDCDQMPRSLVLTIIAGSLLGIGFWAAVTELLIRY